MFLQNKLCSIVLNPQQPTYLFHRQTGQDSCRNQSGWLPKQRQVLQKCFLKDTIGWTQGVFIQEKRHNKCCWFDPAWRDSGQFEHNNQIFSCIQSHKHDPLKRCSTACVAFLQFYFLSNVIQLVFDDIHEDIVTDEVVAMSR